MNGRVATERRNSDRDPSRRESRLGAFVIWMTLTCTTRFGLARLKIETLNARSWNF
jgi:hypothetical protein